MKYFKDPLKYVQHDYPNLKSTLGSGKGLKKPNETINPLTWTSPKHTVQLQKQSTLHIIREMEKILRGHRKFRLCATNDHTIKRSDACPRHWSKARGRATKIGLISHEFISCSKSPCTHIIF